MGIIHKEKLLKWVQVLCLLLCAIMVLSACGKPRPDHIRFEGKDYTFESEDSETKRLKYTRASGGISSSESFNLYIMSDSEGITVTYNNKDYVIEGDEEVYTVTYPNGASSKVTYQSGGSVTTGYSTVTGDVGGYPNAMDMDVFFDYTGSGSSADLDGSQVLKGMVMILIGGFCALTPETAFYLSRGWRYRDAEPSDLYLWLTRFSGIVICIVGLIFLLTSCMG